MKKYPIPIKKITTATFTITMKSLNRADSRMPRMRMAETAQMNDNGDEIDASRHGIEWGSDHGARQVNAERQEDGIERRGPTDRNRCRSHRIFEHQRPADHPRHQFAHGRVGVSVCASGDGNHGREFAVANSGKRAAERRQQERIHHRRTGVRGRGHSGQREYSSADDRADSQGDQRERAQASLQSLFAFRFG